MTAAGNSSGITVSGLSAQVAIQHHEPTDQLFVKGLGGADNISATGLAAGAITEFLDGGDGNDTIAGGQERGDAPRRQRQRLDRRQRRQRQRGSRRGRRHVRLGDGGDTINGDDGRDTMVFNGAAASETVDLSANGNRLRFFRQPANITMDTGGVEFVTFNALGGADNVTVNNLITSKVSGPGFGLRVTRVGWSRRPCST